MPSEGLPQNIPNIKQLSESGDIVRIHPEWHGLKLLEGEERKKSLEELNELEGKIRELNEAILAMSDGLRATQPIDEETQGGDIVQVGLKKAKKFLRRDIANTLRHISRQPLNKPAGVKVLELDQPTKDKIKKQIDKSEAELDVLLSKKYRIEGKIYTPEELDRFDEVENAIGRPRMFDREYLTKQLGKLEVRYRVGQKLRLNEKGKRQFRSCPDMVVTQISHDPSKVDEPIMTIQSPVDKNNYMVRLQSEIDEYFDRVE